MSLDHIRIRWQCAHLLATSNMLHRVEGLEITDACGTSGTIKLGDGQVWQQQRAASGSDCNNMMPTAFLLDRNAYGALPR